MKRLQVQFSTSKEGGGGFEGSLRASAALVQGRRRMSQTIASWIGLVSKRPPQFELWSSCFRISSVAAAGLPSDQARPPAMAVTDLSSGATRCVGRWEGVRTKSG